MPWSALPDRAQRAPRTVCHVVFEDVNPIVSAVRTVFSAVQSTIAAMPMRRAIGITATIVILVAVAVWVPLPSALQMRDWAAAAGPWFPLAFFVAHTLITVLPFPRTAFTLAAGLLFGSGLGVTLAVAASTISALIALWLVRTLGWQLSRLSHKHIDSLDARLKERGWASVLAMRRLAYVGHLERGKWKPAPAGLAQAEVATALAFAALPFAVLAFGLFPWAPAAAGLVCGGLLAVALALTARRLLGGYTGDVLGAIEQAFELGAMLGFAGAVALLQSPSVGEVR